VILIPSFVEITLGIDVGLKLDPEAADMDADNE